MMYNETVLKHFKNPHNQGSIDNPTVIGEAGNPICGDLMKLYVKLSDEPKDINKKIIEDVKFETLGCGAAIATSSMLTDMAKGKTVEEALKISKDDVANALDGLPPQKIHCSLLATEALHNAIDKING